jgi:hypothetical protein
MRMRYFGWEYVFEFIWKNADRDGMWNGDASAVAAAFNVGEDEAHEMLAALCDRGHVERLVPGTYAITEWRERDEPGEGELAW